MKHKFILSIIITLVTMIVFVTSIFAWMTINNSVGAGGFSGSTIEISTIDIKMYNTKLDGTNYVIDGVSQTEITMPVYSETANSMILVEVNVNYNNTLNHELLLVTNQSSITFSGYNKQDDTIKSHLSNTIAIYEANYINGVITKIETTKKTFFKDYSKKFSISLKNGITGQVDTNETFYFVIDYDAGLFDNIYTTLLSSEFSNDATINTKVIFESDISFRLEGAQ